MGLMHKAISAALVLAVAIAATPVASASAPAAKHTSAPHAKPTPAPLLASPPPEISHVVSRPFCSALRNSIGPAIGAILQNDSIIKQNNKYFDDYIKADGNGEFGDASKQITILHMENTVGPIVANIANVEKILNNQAVFHVPSHTNDEKRLLEIREGLLESLALQKASLDVINGFVQTEQLGQLQHQGDAENKQIIGNDQAKTQTNLSTPLPGTVDPNAAGLPQDPHFIDPATIPGLSLGSNPISRLNDGLKWTQAQARDRENVAAPKVMDAAHICSAPAKPAVPPTPIATP